MRNTSRLTILLFALFVLVGCDQATKVVAQRRLSGMQPLSFFGNIFRLEYAENPGAFLSFGAGLSDDQRFWVFVVIVGAILLAASIFLLRSYATWPMTSMIALVLVISGGFSNLLSRILNDGHVIDFMNVGIGWLRTGTFNIADMAIMAGVITLFISGMQPDHPANQPEAAATVDSGLNSGQGQGG